MRNLTALVAIAAAIVLTLSATASAGTKTVGWLGTLTVTQEIPKQAVKQTAANGYFSATLTGNKLKFKLTFAKLSGAATMAHIHLGAKGVAGKILIPLCAPCKSPVSGTVTVSAAVQKDFAKRLLYVNVHTAKNPAGEIRGQLTGGASVGGNNG